MKKIIVCLLIITAMLMMALPVASEGLSDNSATLSETTAVSEQSTAELTTEDTAAAVVGDTVSTSQSASQPQNQVGVGSEEKAADTTADKKQNQEVGNMLGTIAMVWLGVLTVVFGVIIFIALNQLKKTDITVQELKNEHEELKKEHVEFKNQTIRVIRDIRSKQNGTPQIGQVQSNNPKVVPVKGSYYNQPDNITGIRPPEYGGDSYDLTGGESRNIFSNGHPVYGDNAGANEEYVEPVVKKSFLESVNEEILSAYRNGTKFSFAHKYVEFYESETKLSGKVTVQEKNFDKVKYVIFEDTDNGKLYLLPNPLYYNSNKKSFSLNGSSFGQCIATNGNENGVINNYQPTEIEKSADGVYQVVKIGKIIWR